MESVGTLDTLCLLFWALFPGLIPKIFPLSVYCYSALWSLCLCHEVIWQWKTSQIKETQHNSAVISIKFTSVELECRNEHWMLLLCDLGSVSNLLLLVTHITCWFCLFVFHYRKKLTWWLNKKIWYISSMNLTKLLQPLTKKTHNLLGNNYC